MVFSKKGLFLIGVGFIPLVINKQGTIAVWIAYLIAMSVMLAIDFRFSATKEDFEVLRIYPERFALAAQNKVQIQIRNRGKNAVNLVVKDDFPIEINGLRETVNLYLMSGDTGEVEYLLTPYKRGLFYFGAVNLRILSRLGLYYRQVKYCEDEQRVKVYPNILAGRQEFLKLEQGFWQKEHINSLRLATGTDFRGIREYISGDEFRKINWKATARQGRMMINEYREDRSQPVYIVLDNGRMMTERVGHLSKLDHAINASAILAYIGLARGEQVGLAAFDKKMHTFAIAAKGKGQFQLLMEQMYQMEPTLAEANYSAFWQFFRNKQRRRSLVCVFTDMVDAEASRELVINLGRLARQHLVLCVILKDRELENKAAITPESYQEVYEKGVAIELLQARAKAIARLKGAGVIVIDETPEMIGVATVNKYLELKARMR